ncbi:hypothetical protein ACFPN2_02205 [Steroidobacter flavus]|uniref:Cytochrome c domain-containing protein n=1 Tax=Steroidobacter flavus TaxID=1842136 RepID=A0ABV8SK24_9GAMM
MSRVLWTLLCYLAVVSCSENDSPDHATAESRAVTFPLEVLGAPGKEVALIVKLDAATLSSTSTVAVALTLHNIVQTESADLAINGGPPIDLSSADGPFNHPDGRVTTATVPIDRAQLVAGNNRFVFRYKRQVVDDGSAISGYRVLKVAINVGDRTIQVEAPAEDPQLWRPMREDAQSLERGRFFFSDVSRDDGPACTRCHADSGADLQYYAFSNNSIVERAMFHRFTREEAEDIASYIRSLNVVSAGRPYQAPFQPGADNVGAAGASINTVLTDDAAFAKSVVSYAPWESAGAVDTFLLPTSVQAPTWLRWLPRTLDPTWFTRNDGVLAKAEQALASEPSIENARTFMSAAMRVGTDVLVTTGDHHARIDVLRFAAVKLWDWSRRSGFNSPDHGLPDGGPAYPYEVGFAFFEAAAAGKAVQEAMDQTMSWWWAQLAANPGRGLSSGRRPLNYQDVLTAASGAGLGPEQLRFLYLYGSWEESRGELATAWGTEQGPVRLLDVPLSTLAFPDRLEVVLRFLRRETEFLNSGGQLTQGHHRTLAQAWNRTCEQFTADQRATVRAAAPTDVWTDLAGCP